MSVEQIVLDAAVALHDDVFRERVRAELMHFISTDALVQAEIARQVEREMKRYKQVLAGNIAKAYEESIYEKPNF